MKVKRDSTPLLIVRNGFQVSASSATMALARATRPIVFTCGRNALPFGRGQHFFNGVNRTVNHLYRWLAVQLHL